MGLENSFEFNGLDVPRAYWRLAEFHWSITEPLTARVELLAYASQDAFKAGCQPLTSKSFTLDLTDANGNPELVKVELLVRVRSLCYMELKKFPEMEGALDL